MGDRGSYGAWGRIRTTDTRIFSPLLYQLSYPGAPGQAGGGGLQQGRRACPEPLSIRVVTHDGFFLVLVGVAGRNGVAADKPALKINVGAAP